MFKLLSPKARRRSSRASATPRLKVESLEDRRMWAVLFNFSPVGNLASMLSGSQGVPAQQRCPSPRPGIRRLGLLSLGNGGKALAV